MDIDERWKEISRIYDAALARTGDESRAFVAAACGADEALRREVESLLGCDSDADDLLKTPAGDVMAKTIEVMAKAMAADAGSLIGRQVGYYRIDARLGAGGMGEVYKATDTRLLRPVALKILPKHLRDPHLRRRFDQEAQTVAAVRHPHICVLHDIGQDGEIEFLVMEYLEGETLAERLTRGPLPVDEAFRCATEIADALVATHQQGITHRDLKPGNVMLTTSGAKLLDFGLATLRSAVSPPDLRSAKPDSSATPAAIVGTPSYMAPEQLQGQETDHRTDIFAFGTLLYEMVTGRRAFDETSRSELAAAILTSEPAPMADEVPPAVHRLDPLIRRCLAKEPNERWQNTSDMATELRQLAGAMPTSRARRATYAMVALGAVVALAGAALWRAGLMDPLLRPASPGTAPLQFGKTDPLTPEEEQLEVDPTFSPDGTRVAFTAGTANRMRIFIREIASGHTVSLSADPSVRQFQPRWSPRGDQIVYITLEGAFVVSSSGGTPKRLDSPSDAVGAHLQNRNPGIRVFGAAWSPDGLYVAIAYGGLLTIVPTNGGERRTLPAQSAAELHHCDWSPDFRWIACVSGNWRFAGPLGLLGNIAPSAIVLIPAWGGRIIEITDRTHMNVNPAWSPDSARLYFVSNRQGASDIYSAEVSSDGHVRDDPVRVTTAADIQSFAFSADMKRLAYTKYSARSNIWSLPIPRERVNISGARQLTYGDQIVEAVLLSPDAKWLLYDSTLYRNADIFRIPIDGGQFEQLTTDTANEFAPKVSPDGVWLAYHSFRYGTRDVFVQPLTGGPAEPVTRTPSHESYPWFLDSRSLIFTDQVVNKAVASGAFLVRRELSGRWGKPRPMNIPPGTITLLPNGSLAVTYAGDIVIASESPVIRQVVYRPTSSADPYVECVRVAGEDDSTLYFKTHDAEGLASFWSVPASGGQPVQLVRFDDPSRPSSRVEFAVGAGRFFFTIDDRRSDIWLAEIVTER